MKKYDFGKIEKKWKKEWEERGIYRATDKSGKEKKYVLTEFPYPSGEGLHMGHLRPYVAGDVYSRYLRRRGYETLYPIGWDAFGLPAENYAIKKGIHPRLTTAKNIANAKEQLKNWGIGFDWSREVDTTDPEYYKWTQWIFLQFYKSGLAYEATGKINWCPKDKTGLANEEVVGGRCERCGTAVEEREMKQWYLKITAYAEKLLAGLKNLDWPDFIKVQQENWIGRSEGAEIKFKVQNTECRIKIFTTRPDTLFGATYMVLAPEHELLANGELEIENCDEVRAYVEKAKKKTDEERRENKEKTGVRLEGIEAINPANGEAIPVFVADYVLSGYGTGAIMAVPAHDERDWEFAKKHNLPIREVIEPRFRIFFYYPYALIDNKVELEINKLPFHSYSNDGRRINLEGSNREHIKLMDKIREEIKVGTFYFDNEISQESFRWVDSGVTHAPFTLPGRLINSGKFSGMDSEEVKWAITKAVGGRKQIQYKLRDWVFSRQRYWGEPIPLIHCEKCGVVPVPEEDLPVLLPEVKKYEPTGTGESPLAAIKDWVNTECPKCKGAAKRETNTMPQWAGSSWYYLRYIDPRNQKVLADKELLRYWLPVDVYFGGLEHTTLHLLYSRFWHQFLYDQGVVPTPEPYVRRVPHGIILGADGEKMSKSRGNVVNPDTITEKFGADALRLYEMFLGPHGATVSWNDQAILGVVRFLERVWKINNQKSTINDEENKGSREFQGLLHKSINKITEDIEGFQFNTAISQLMILFSAMEKEPNVSLETKKVFWKLLAPFAPFLTEELWHQSGEKESVHLTDWPVPDSEWLRSETINLVIQFNGKVRGILPVKSGISESEARVMAEKDGRFKKYLTQPVRKIIFVKNRLINFVT